MKITRGCARLQTQIRRVDYFLNQKLTAGKLLVPILTQCEKIFSKPDKTKIVHLKSKVFNSKSDFVRKNINQNMFFPRSFVSKSDFR